MPVLVGGKAEAGRVKRGMGWEEGFSFLGCGNGFCLAISYEKPPFPPPPLVGQVDCPGVRRKGAAPFRMATVAKAGYAQRGPVATKPNRGWVGKW